MSERAKMSRLQRRAPQQARSRVTVDAILDATARILREGGVAALNTNAISEVAGVGIGTLYGYFPNKTAILVALARRLLAEDEAAMLEASAAAPSDDVLRTVVRTLLERHRCDAAVRRAVMGVHHGQGLSSEQSSAAERTIGRLLQDGGLLRATARDNPARVFVITRAVLGVARAMIEEGEGAAAPQQIEDELVRLCRLCLSPTNS